MSASQAVSSMDSTLYIIFPFRLITARKITVFIMNFDTDFNKAFHRFSVFPVYNYSNAEVTITMN
jgi:hypothetical protein